MKISYDPEVDALSITFRETTVTTKHLAEGIAADYDAVIHGVWLLFLDNLMRFFRSPGLTNKDSGFIPWTQVRAGIKYRMERDPDN